MEDGTNKTSVLTKEECIKLRKELLGEEEINFHTFLKKRLIELNLQQKHLADMCNVSDKTISKWCSGRGLPDIMMIPVLAETLDVSIHAITNSIFGIRDYYTVKDLTSRAILDGAIKEKNEFPDANCIAGSFIGKSEYNLYLLLKHIYKTNGVEYTINNFLNSDEFRRICSAKRMAVLKKAIMWFQNAKTHNWYKERDFEFKKGVKQK